VVPPDYTKLEAATREEIDQKLAAAGWAMQDKKGISNKMRQFTIRAAT